MPKGPKGQRRPDVISNAIKVARIATGEEQEDFGVGDDGKDRAAQSLGQRGGRARARSLSESERRAIAKKAAQARWKKDPAEQG